VSGFPSWRVADLVGLSKRTNVARPEAIQIDYSLLQRGLGESEARDLVREYRLGLLARSPLARGRLAPPAAHSAFAAGTSESDRVLDGLVFLARERGASVAQVAL